MAAERLDLTLFTPIVMETIRTAYESSPKRYKGELVMLSKQELLDLYDGDIESILEDQELAGLCNRDDNVFSKGSKIGTSYIEESYIEALENDYMDFLGFFENPIVDDEDSIPSLKLLSFIIVHYGECRILPNIWAVNLICALRLPGSGQILMASFLYAAKMFYRLNHMRDQRVILELVDGYANPQGFTNYTRLGFKRDASLFYPEDDDTCSDWKTRSCFCDNSTMPMSNDLSRFRRRNLLDMITGSYIAADNDSTGFLRAMRSGFTSKHANKEDIDLKTALCAHLATRLFSAEKSIELARRSEKDPSKFQKRLEKRAAELDRCNQELIAMSQPQKSPPRAAPLFSSTTPYNVKWK